MVIPSFEKAHVSGVTVMQNRIAAISLDPVLCLMQWDGKITYLTALRDFYSLLLALSEGMAACRIYWSHCFTEKQKLPEPLTGCGWCNCPQHTSCKTQYSLEMWEQVPSQQSLPSVCCHHIRLWFIESDLICLFFIHPAEALTFPFLTDRAEQNLSVLWAVALSPRASVSCVAYWALDGCN